MQNVLIGFGFTGIVLAGIVYAALLGKDVVQVTKTPQPVVGGVSGSLNLQTMDEETLKRVVGAGPQPGTFKGPTEPPPGLQNAKK